MEQSLNILDRLQKIEELLHQLVERETAKEWYTTAEVAKKLGRAEFTVREWCRLGRIDAQKRQTGRGKYPTWIISHDELQRYQRDGLLPQSSGRLAA
jgi:transposase